MKLYIEDEQQFLEKHLAIKAKIEAVIQAAKTLEGVKEEVEISLSIVSKEEIHQINMMHREKDAPTDVLSFPQIEPEDVDGINWDALDTTMYINRDNNHLMLGDIVLCDEVAKEQAKTYGHSLEREVCFLVAHSMFHLLGYDHMTEVDEVRMISKQNEVLDQLGITR